VPRIIEKIPKFERTNIQVLVNPELFDSQIGKIKKMIDEALKSNDVNRSFIFEPIGENCSDN
jgi:hypothetical protein